MFINLAKICDVVNGDIEDGEFTTKDTKGLAQADATKTGTEDPRKGGILVLIGWVTKNVLLNS